MRGIGQQVCLAAFGLGITGPGWATERVSWYAGAKGIPYESEALAAALSWSTDLHESLAKDPVGTMRPPGKACAMSQDGRAHVSGAVQAVVAADALAEQMALATPDYVTATKLKTATVGFVNSCPSDLDAWERGSPSEYDGTWWASYSLLKVEEFLGQEQQAGLLTVDTLIIAAGQPDPFTKVTVQRFEQRAERKESPRKRRVEPILLTPYQEGVRIKYEIGSGMVTVRGEVLSGLVVVVYPRASAGHKDVELTFSLDGGGYRTEAWQGNYLRFEEFLNERGVRHGFQTLYNIEGEAISRSCLVDGEKAVPAMCSRR